MVPSIDASPCLRNVPRQKDIVLGKTVFGNEKHILSELGIVKQIISYLTMSETMTF
jgi:hypothetical protein